MKTVEDVERIQIELIQNAVDLTAEQLASIRFFDVEASSLSADSFPVEVAYCGLDMAVESRLIKPLPTWTDWSEAAEANHGITRDLLDREGHDASAVADLMAFRFARKRVFSDAPHHDNRWAARLFTDTGRTRRFEALDYDGLQRPCQKIALETMGIAQMNRLERKVEIVYLHTHRAGDDVTKMAANLRFLVDPDWRDWFERTDYSTLVRSLGREPERRWVVEEEKANFDAARAAETLSTPKPRRP